MRFRSFLLLGENLNPRQLGGNDKFSRKGVNVRLCSPLALEKYFKTPAGVVGAQKQLVIISCLSYHPYTIPM